LHHEGVVYERSASKAALYSKFSAQAGKTRPISLTFIPYYAWANRNATAMQVWTPVISA
jgi:DUF1680 family protein